MSFALPERRTERTAAATGRTPATPGRRTVAAVVDGLLVVLTAGVGSVFLQSGIREDAVALKAVGAGLFLLWFIGVLIVGVLFAATGVSPGKKVARLRLIRWDTGGAPGLGVAWGRCFLAGIGNVLVIGWVVAVIQIFQGGNQRTWYDSMTNALLVDDIRSTPEFDPTRGAAWVAPGDRGGAAVNTLEPMGVSRFAPAGSAASDMTGRSPGPVVPMATLRDVPDWRPQTESALSWQRAQEPVEPVRGVSASAVSAGVFSPPPSATPEQAAAFAVPSPPPPPPTEGIAWVAPPGPLMLRTPPPPGVGGEGPAGGGALRPSRVEPPPINGVVPVRAVLAFESGEIEEVSGTGVLGRNPLPVVGGVAIRVVDPTRTVSKSHLAFVVEESGFVVTDLGSTNGSTVMGLDGIRRVLEAEVPTWVDYGSTITIGEHGMTVNRAIPPGDTDGFVDITVLSQPH